MFPISMHTAQPVAPDRRNRSEVAPACHRLGRSLAGAVDAGHNHAPWTSHLDRTNRTIEEFLTHGPPRQKQRALKTVLFSDIVSSTACAAAMGDEQWSALLQRFGEVTTGLADRFGGTVVKSTGDGHLATFEGPTVAIRCAEALRTDAESLGIKIRTGVHTGECELIGDDIGGIAVHIAGADHGARRAR